MSVAVHFGAGNIGRGFVGLLLSQAGYEVVFADVQTALVDAINAAGRYRVHEEGAEAAVHEVEGVRAIDSGRDPDALADLIASAEVVTTAVGPSVLRFVAPAIAEGLRRRPSAVAPLVVMACENAIGATDQLRAHIEDVDPLAAGRARYANTAVDRIVPVQPDREGLDVTVERYYEWVIDRSGLDTVPEIPGTLVVDRLEPYIERKLFTVNTGHATVAYHGARAGVATIAEAMAVPAVLAELHAVLAETSEALVRKHGLDPDQQSRYADRIVGRFLNPYLPDTVQRVGREPLRKLGRHERFVAPAAELAEAGTTPVALLRAIGAALAFRSGDDPQAVELAERLAALAAEEFVAEVTGIEPGHPLHAPLVEVVAAAQRG